MRLSNRMEKYLTKRVYILKITYNVTNEVEIFTVKGYHFTLMKKTNSISYYEVLRTKNIKGRIREAFHCMGVIFL